jgi:hypothetical protein
MRGSHELGSTLLSKQSNKYPTLAGSAVQLSAYYRLERCTKKPKWLNDCE